MTAPALNHSHALLLIVVVAAGLRFVAVPVLHDDQYYTGDEREYMYLASKLAGGGDFVDTNGEYSTRSPLYPYLISVLFLTGGSGIFLAHTLGVLLGVVLVLLCYKISVRLFDNELWALATAAVVALYPGLITYSALLQTEMLFLVLFAGSFLAGWSLLEKPTLVRGGFLGLIAGMTVLVRAVYLGFFPVFLLTLLVAGGRKWKTLLLPVTASVVVFVGINIPWGLRNHEIHDAIVPVSLWGGRSVLVANNPYATGTWSNKPGFEEWFDQELVSRGLGDRSRVTEYQLSTVSRQIGFEYMLSHPGHTVSLALTRAHIFWIYPITNSDTDLLLQAVASGADILLLLCAAVGLVRLRRSRDRRFVPIVAAFAVFFAIHLVMQSEARYRLPIVPFLCLFAGTGLGVALRKETFLRLWAEPGDRLRLISGSLIVTVVYGLTGLLFLEGRI